MANTSMLYTHTRNEDGNYHSVCQACLAAIAFHQDEAALAREEEEHVCRFAYWSPRATSLKRSTAGPNGKPQRTVHAGIW